MNTLYTATKTSNVSSILKHGLRLSTSTKSHWDKDVPLGRIFLTTCLDNAYIWAKWAAEAQGSSWSILEVEVSSAVLHVDEDSSLNYNIESDQPLEPTDFYVTRPIPPDHIKVYELNAEEYE